MNTHLDLESTADILLEEAAYRCFDLARTDLAQIVQPTSNHLKSAVRVYENVKHSNCCVHVTTWRRSEQLHVYVHVHALLCGTSLNFDADVKRNATTSPV